MNSEKRDEENEFLVNPFGINYTKRFVSDGENQLFKKHELGKTGLIELVDYIGGDETVERVATLGYGTSIFPENPDEIDFIHYLVSNGIYEPFSSVQLKFNIQSPIFTALTLVYEPGVNVNEYSGRYSVMLDSSFELDKNSVSRRLKGDNRASRASKITEIFAQNRKQTSDNYKELINLDMARELARAGLGIDNDTKYFWKIDLSTLSKFINSKRKFFDTSDPTRINYPTRNYIEVIAEIAEKIAPISWDALTRTDNADLKLTMPRDNEIIDSGLKEPNWDKKETRRVTVSALEEILFVKKSFLDYGEFQVVDYMGDDNSFAEAARVSYGEGTKTLQDNKNLIRSLIRDLHTSPIEMAELAFEAKSPVFSDPRQAGRHRTLDKHGFMGYFPIGDQFYIPGDEEFKYQDKLNRQGRGKEMDGDDLKKAKENFISDKKREIATARELKELDAPEDIIRMVKGVGFYTKVWRTGDTHNLGNFLRLRLDIHAQKEVRELAQLVNYAVSLHTPIAHEAINNYTINGMRLSEKEIKLIQEQGMLKDNLDLENLDNYKGVGFLIPIGKDDKTKGYKLNREGLDFKKKLERLLGDK